VVFEKRVVAEGPENRIFKLKKNVLREEAIFQKMCFSNSNLMICDEKMIYQFMAARNLSGISGSFSDILLYIKPIFLHPSCIK